jgi:LuxR family transcriptional regulator, maltose regulon positive regulatory protein
VTAIRTAVDGVGAGALQMLAAAVPSSRSIEAALVALLNDLTRMSRDLLLVVDDLHLVEASDVYEGLTFLLEHRPPKLHVVLATRVDPPLPLARMRAGGSAGGTGRRSAFHRRSPGSTSTARWGCR